MRDIIIAGNWKMNKDLDAVRAFCKAIAGGLKGKVLGRVLPIIAPTYPFLALMQREFAGSPFRVAAQDTSSHPDGAFTGEVSATMLASLGLQYCIVGHSERRAYHHESNETIREKVLAVMDSGMKPILCIGETLEQRDGGITDQVILEQLDGCMRGVRVYTGKELILAYEPVWAIGTGRNATGEQAQEVHRQIRKWLADQYNKELADNLSILYGGSVKPQNLTELLAMPDIDGGLIGGASLDPESFLKMVDIAINYK
ncbi:MAG: triose-phosphate isomerase [Candidatus Cloacimonetes bacterium]|nr:triose-phosphate isomerase [Candidatus Cloacimonadota bacterium]MDY0336560.1 triose-phosphate isomerase [Candidatus Cloacimonadaceae bacterium]MCB5270204.1 triose-phosphate isomerase [Candidatus Cloacimonadota bacterium]MCK9334089.1 triose-phosphate isomerase [Candidatus Cloacimonadota bacterium]MDD2543194.1 triose-phosphate isomerase [Candidatus Cloacimonadota bacterium]